MLPELSTARPFGSTTCPFPDPIAPKDVRNVPLLANSWTRLLNCPLPGPAVPHAVRNVPELVNFSIRLLDESLTYTLPEASTAMPVGLLNWPLPGPDDPHFKRKFPELSNF